MTGEVSSVVNKFRPSSMLITANVDFVYTSRLDEKKKTEQNLFICISKFEAEVTNNKCIEDDMKAAARQSPNCISKKTKRNKIWRKTIFNMADRILLPCNAARISGIMTLISLGDSTLQCGRWLWDDMPLNSRKRPPYWNSTSGFHFHTSPQSTCHSVRLRKFIQIGPPSAEKNDVMSIFKMADLSHLEL